MTILIEIKNSSYKNGLYDIRIGDIAGSIEITNSTKEDLLKEIDRELEEEARRKRK